MMSKFTRQQNNILKSLYFESPENRAVLNQFENRKRGRHINVSEVANKGPITDDVSHRLFERLLPYGFGHLNGDHFYLHCDMSALAAAVSKAKLEFARRKNG